MREGKVQKVMGNEVRGKEIIGGKVGEERENKGN